MTLIRGSDGQTVKPYMWQYSNDADVMWYWLTFSKTMQRNQYPATSSNQPMAFNSADRNVKAIMRPA